MTTAEAAVKTRAQATPRRSAARRLLVLAVVAAAFGGSVWKLSDHRRYRRALIEVKQEIRAGRHGHAARKLAMLLAWQPDSDEAAYWLGVCEKAQGQPLAAFRAWERVSPASPFGPRAIQGQMELLLERGRLADAEALILRAMSDPRADASKLGLFLGLVYSLQGRVEDRQRVIEASWSQLDESGEGASETAILLVRLHIQTPTPEEVRATLDQSARSDPEDDRVWLGKAKLAIRDGLYDEAARWLEACLRRRPDDLPVWRTRLDWALATRRLADVRQALGHLPVEESTPAQIQRLTAWLAAFRSDLDAERRALEQLAAIDPADRAALDRLEAIAVKEGRSDRAGEYRRRKDEIARLQVRYEKLYRRNQSLRDAAEMAGLAKQLGRSFEAKVFRTIAMATDPGHDDTDVDSGRDVPVTHSSRGTLADLLGEELAAADRTRTR